MGLRVILFVQEGCLACTEQAPVSQSVSAATGIPIEEIDVMKDRSFIRQFRLTVTPTTVLLRDGNELARFEGVVQREALEEAIRRFL